MNSGASVVSLNRRFVLCALLVSIAAAGIVELKKKKKLYLPSWLHSVGCPELEQKGWADLIEYSRRLGALNYRSYLSKFSYMFSVYSNGMRCFVSDRSVRP